MLHYPEKLTQLSVPLSCCCTYSQSGRHKCTPQLVYTHMHISITHFSVHLCRCTYTHTCIYLCFTSKKTRFHFRGKWQKCHFLSRRHTNCTTNNNSPYLANQGSPEAGSWIFGFLSSSGIQCFPLDRFRRYCVTVRVVWGTG